MRSVDGPAETRVESVMTRNVQCMDADEELLSAIKTMSARRKSCIVVTEGGKVCGVLTERDVTRLAATRTHELDSLKIRDGMSAAVTSIGPDTTLAEAASLMKKHDYRRFPVLSENGELLGIVTQSDIVTGLNRALENYSHYLEGQVEARTRSLQEANAELARLSVTDPLTGLHNRRALYLRLEEVVSRLQRSGGHLSCVMIDIDHFKQVNDNYGHQAGDEVLKELARVMAGSVRRHDFVARYGGEELLILTECTEDQAAGAAERIRENTERLRFQSDSAVFSVTVSAGVAEKSFPSADPNADDLLIRSDEALYAAKRTGRNRVATASGLRDICCR